MPAVAYSASQIAALDLDQERLMAVNHGYHYFACGQRVRRFKSKLHHTTEFDSGASLCTERHQLKRDRIGTCTELISNHNSFTHFEHKGLVGSLDGDLTGISPKVAKSCKFYT